MIFAINTTPNISKLFITILKYHSWYLCQLSLQIVLLPILIFRFLLSFFFVWFLIVWLFHVFFKQLDGVRVNRTAKSNRIPRWTFTFRRFSSSEIDKSSKEIKLYSIISQLKRFSYGVIQHLDFEGASIFKYLYVTYFIVIISFCPPYSVIEM